jgi:hypothetical protein
MVPLLMHTSILKYPFEVPFTILPLQDDRTTVSKPWLGLSLFSVVLMQMLP